MVIIDTSVWIEASRLKGELEYKIGLESLLEEYEAAWCSPVKLEFLGGARKQDRRKLEFWLDCIPYRDANEADWESAKFQSWKLRETGITVPWNDLLIASIALNSDCRVYAKDKHFEAMAKHLGLRLYQPGYGGRYQSDN